MLASRSHSRRRLSSLLAIAAIPFAGPAVAQQCSQAASLMLDACGFEVQDEEAVGKAKCLQISNSSARSQCNAEVADEKAEHLDLCDEQAQARTDACDAIGDTRYDPVYSPLLFDTNYATPPHPNSYFPLKTGDTWQYSTGPEQRTVVHVTNRTKRIEGLTCVVVSDTVTEDGVATEVTNDWMCQAKSGDVHYLGEETAEYETFEGDKPQLAERVSTDGSFKSGRDHNKGGILFPANPVVGKVYYEEFALGDAEDIAKILSTSYHYGSNASLDQLVPAALAQYFCGAGDCVVTENTSQLEPGVVERKYYARGIGVFLETDLDAGEADRLTSCNFDSRCSGIPQL
jgi:hypothetical protein